MASSSTTGNLKDNAKEKHHHQQRSDPFDDDQYVIAPTKSKSGISNPRVPNAIFRMISLKQSLANTISVL